MFVECVRSGLRADPARGWKHEAWINIRTIRKMVDKAGFLRIVRITRSLCRL